MGEPPLRGAVLWRPSENQIIMLKIIFPIIISETKTPREIRGAFFIWLRRLDLNQRPSGYGLRFVCGGETFRPVSGPSGSENHALWPCLFHWFHGLRFPYGSGFGSESGKTRRSFSLWNGLLGRQMARKICPA